jgi:predicted nucleic acid-binding protein
VHEVERLSAAGREVSVSPHILFELYKGLMNAPSRDREVRWIERLGEDFGILPFERRAARMAAQMFETLKREGLSVPNEDLFIASSALVWGDGELVTRDVRHFRKLARFGLRVTTWSE